MRYTTMGRTGVQVSVVGLGGNVFGSPVDEAGAAAIVDRAADLGVNFLDTSESYSGGRSEEILGRALRGRRDAFVLASKTGYSREPGSEAGGRLTRKRIIERLEGSLRRLATDYLDIFYFHFPDPLTPLEESMRALDDLVRAGKVRYLGISNVPAWQVAEAAGIAAARGISGPAVAQGTFNMLDRGVEAEVLPACAHFGVSFVPSWPLAGGFLTGKYERGKPVPADTRFARSPAFYGQRLTEANFDRLDRWRAFAQARGHSMGELAVAWLASHPEVCSVIAGTTSPEQVASNAKAADWVLTAAEMAELG